jgi:hypothetical protein
MLKKTNLISKFNLKYIIHFWIFIKLFWTPFGYHVRWIMSIEDTMEQMVIGWCHIWGIRRMRYHFSFELPLKMSSGVVMIDEMTHLPLDNPRHDCLIGWKKLIILDPNSSISHQIDSKNFLRVKSPWGFSLQLSCG